MFLYLFTEIMLDLLRRNLFTRHQTIADHGVGLPMKRASAARTAAAKRPWTGLCGPLNGEPSPITKVCLIFNVRLSNKRHKALLTDFCKRLILLQKAR